MLQSLVTDWLVSFPEPRKCLRKTEISDAQGQPRGNQAAFSNFGATRRLSVGIEDAEDLIADLDHALKAGAVSLLDPTPRVTLGLF